MFYKRQITEKIEYLAKHFPIVLITGARQIGKTTVLKQLAEKYDINYVSLDYPQIRQMAKTEPALFLQQYQPPLIIDEIQYAPELFSYLKINVDEKNKNGMYYLTGSQGFNMMKGVRESLAGRIGIINMYSMSQREILEQEFKQFNPSTLFNEKDFLTTKAPTTPNIFETIFKGGMPKLITDKELNPNDYFSSYIQTYLEKDIKDIIDPRNETKFINFLSLIAARSGCELNYNEIANLTGVDSKTIQGWVSVLESSGVVYLLRPFYLNITKRIIKRPKIYFMDTGLACYLSYANNPKALSVSSAAGHIFETFIISEIIKGYRTIGIDTSKILSYYRDNNHREIDLIINSENTYHPIEIKMSAEPQKDAIKHFRVLDDMNLNIGKGYVICQSPIAYPLNENAYAIPWQMT